MNVKELIEELSLFPDNMDVKFSYDYGDHCHNHVASSIKGVESGKIIYSDYHRMDKVAAEYEIEQEETREVILLC